MNEELKIIITAATEGAKKGISDVKKQLGGVTDSAKGASGGISTTFKGVAVGAAAAIGAIVAVGAALVKLGKATLDYQKAHAKLNTAFQAAGSTVQQAAESYKGLFRFLGDEDTSVEAAAHLAKLTTNQKELAEWTKICQGVYSVFGDSLKTEALTEAANETARVGTVTGAMADALNWAGVSEDEFNAKLARTTSFEEREALIRSTLNGLYSEAAEIYERNNKKLLDYNESQARLNASMASAGQACVPFMTALNNLGAVLFDALKPALDVIVPAMATFVNWVAQGIQAVMGLFGAVTGASSSITSLGTVGSSGIGSAAQGADQLASGLDNAAKAAEKAKRATMGFDELNIVSSGSSGGSGGARGGATGPGYMAPQVGAANFTMEVEQTESKASGLAATMKRIGAELKNIFAPTVTAWTGAFKTVKDAWEDAKSSFIDGAEDIKEAFLNLGEYIVKTFVPDVVNSFSVNLAPTFGDGFAFLLTEASKNFELLGSTVNDATSSLIIPALDSIKTVLTDTFGYIGDAWAEHGEPLMAKLTAATDHIRSVISRLYEQYIRPVGEKIIAVFNKVWTNGLGPLVEKLVSAALEIGECLLDLYNGVLAPILDWIIANVVPIIVRDIESIIDAVGSVVTFVANVAGSLVDILRGVIQFLSGAFTGDWNKAWRGIENIGSSAWEGLKIVWSGAKAFFQSVWSNIKNVFSPVADWFSSTFTKAWTAVKNVFSTGGKIFDGIKDGILSGLKTVVNGIINGINKVVKVPFDGLNSALRKIRDVSVAGLKPFSWISTISVPQIPKLAKGGIVDRATLAMIGERGKEAVVPLENNTAWMDRLVDKLAAKQQAPSKIVLMLDGKELGWANINSINNITRQTGALQLVLT